jgi:LPXTG-site transpeptidase (sortase) family protein
MTKKSQIKFAIYFAIIFVVSFALLYLAGLVPATLQPEGGDSFRTIWDKSQTKAINEQMTENNQVVVAGEEPTRIVIAKIGVDATVANPNTTDANTLDDYLLQGAVRYPGSGLLGAGNLFLFGHSTGIKVVHNQAYKTFNGLKDLMKGDMITVYSANKTYTYQVTSVIMVDQSKALVEFGNTKNMLTLSTCNTFGAKSDRYVVQADYISSI